MRQKILAILLVLTLTVFLSVGDNIQSETGNSAVAEESDAGGNDTIVTVVPIEIIENMDAPESAAVLEENTGTDQPVNEASFSLSGDETVTIQTSTEAVTGTFHYEEAYKVLAMVNAHREEIGVSALTWDEDMKEASQIRAAEATLSWSHTRPNGEAWYAVSPLVKGENLAKGYNSAEDVFTAWMESEGHRENMEWALASTIYVAYFETSTGGYWSMELGY